MTIRVTWSASTDANIASYKIQSSTDQVNWSDRATVTHAIPGPNWSATLNKFYWDDATGDQTTWYRLQAVDSLGQASVWGPAFQADTSEQTYVCGGSMNLQNLMDLVRQESDTENDPHIADDELQRYVNQSRLELYDLLIKTFGEDYYLKTVEFSLTAGVSEYPLPNGVLYDGADCYYKGALVEATSGPNIVTGQPVTLDRFNLREKNRFNLPQSLASYPYLLPRYRLAGSNILFAPTPSSAITVKVWYAPKLRPLVALTDMADDWGGWLEYVVVDAAIKCVMKQERDPSGLIVRKNALKARVEEMAPNRDLAEPNTVTETQPYGLGNPFGAYGLWG